MPAARPRTKARAKPKPERNSTKKPVAYELIGLGLITLGVILLLASRLHGPVPDALLTGLRWLFGTVGAWGVSAALILMGIVYLAHLARMQVSLAPVGMTIVFLTAISMLQLGQQPVWNFPDFAHEPGGLFGSLIARGLQLILGQLAWVVLAAVAIGGIAALTDIPLLELVLMPFRGLYRLVLWAIRPMVQARQEQRAARKAERVAALQRDELRRRNRPDDEEKPEFRPVPEPKPERKVPIHTFAPTVPPTPLPAPAPEPAPKPVAKTEKVNEEEVKPPVQGVPSKSKPDQLEFRDDDLNDEDYSNYQIPPMDLLSVSPIKQKQSSNEAQDNIAVLEETLSSFGIDAKVVEVAVGPRVTRFEVVPPPGIRINRITNLADNIALSLSALDVRVEAPVPGKGVVGIEVPNHEMVMVDLRAICESDPFQNGKTPLTFALGRDIAGKPVCADLTRMPHMLIAGATNSGKSVCINSLICSILMRATPQQVKFIMVDPKRVELSLFQDIPHLISRVAYDAKHAAGLLRWAIREMEQRYEMFAEKCVRNIVGFNEQSRLEGLEDLPYIVIIIDELADLMMQAAAEFEASICRLAQLARATGIHLVVATQRPSVNVITGTIKANIPSRIAFAVASQVDSRTILDMNGAERLVGAGDMLFLPVDASKPARIQGAYVSEKDINRVVEHVKQQGKPHFSEEIEAIEDEAMKSERSGDGGFDESDDERDELFDRALEYIRTTDYASTSMLQRKFRIGYTRAARIMDKFEELGYVGPGQGSKPREVIYAPASSVVGADATFGDSGSFDGDNGAYGDEE